MGCHERNFPPPPTATPPLPQGIPFGHLTSSPPFSVSTTPLRLRRGPALATRWSHSSAVSRLRYRKMRGSQLECRRERVGGWVGTGWWLCQPCMCVKSPLPHWRMPACQDPSDSREYSRPGRRGLTVANQDICAVLAGFRGFRRAETPRVGGGGGKCQYHQGTHCRWEAMRHHDSELARIHSKAGACDGWRACLCGAVGLVAVQVIGGFSDRHRLQVAAYCEEQSL